MITFIKNLTAQKVKNTIITGLFLLILSISSMGNILHKKSFTAYAQSPSASIKIMTFNVLGDPLCKPRNHEKDMQMITDFIKKNDITVAALQETVRLEDDNCHDFNMPDIFEEQFENSGYTVASRQYIGSNDKKWYRIFIYKGGSVPMVTTPIAASNSQGAEAIVLTTPLGKIRFINLHPQPGTQALNLDKMIIPFTETFRQQDDIPMILMGDFNLNYDVSNAGPVMKRIEDSGFYRACNPAKFPSGNCHDTVKGSEGNFAIDHILIDKRAQFGVKNAFVEQSMLFSDHLPLVVELNKNVCPRKSEGDADCNGVINLIDALCLAQEMAKKKNEPCKSADFNNDNVVNITDGSVWRSTFIRESISESLLR